MTRKSTRFAAMLASAAAFSMVATPAFANHNWGWGSRHRDRVDAGDVITGILIIGGIAAIASAASKKDKQKRYERRDRDDRDNGDYYERDQDRDDRDDRPQWQDGTGINGAINRCLNEVSRGSDRQGEVDSVSRDGEGWRVQGRSAGGNFICNIDRSGRIRNIEVG